MVFSKRIVAYWFIFMVFVTFTCSLTYLATQQSMRLGANEIPKQIAVDAEIKLQNGKSPDSIMPVEKMDISKSLDPFIMVFDTNKKMVASSGLIGNHNPSFPTGVLDHVTESREDRVTWQPQTGLRFATVAMKYNSGYIVAARSLQEAENVIGYVSTLIAIVWFICLIFSVILLLVILKVNKKAS